MASAGVRARHNEGLGKHDGKVENGDYRPWSLANWLGFFMERAPPLVFLLLALGPICSSQFLVLGRLDFIRVLLGTVGFLGVLLLVRVMDDVKDFEKDVVLHPERPLPRGLLKFNEVIQAIRFASVALLVYAVFLGLLYGQLVGLSFAMVVLYVLLMYVEFGVGEWLERSPLLYGLSHQAVIFVGAVFACLAAGDESAFYRTRTYALGAVGLSGFFTYEVCRKLDPTLPKLKGTYLIIYGRLNVFIITTFTVLFGAWAAAELRLTCLLWPLQVAMVMSLAVLFLVSPKGKQFKIVEALSIIYLLLHMWSVAVYHYAMAP